MEDIFTWCREGNSLQVRVWLESTENDLNQGDDHGFSPLHWACKNGNLKIVEMLLNHGARVNATNMGDDTPLHLAAAHGHKAIVQLLLQNRADVNFVNEHGNTPLHYACFWGYTSIAEDLIIAGSLVGLCNKDGDCALDKTKGAVLQRLFELANQQGQDMKKIKYKDMSYLGLKTRSKDATLSRHKAIDINDLHLYNQIAITPSGESWRGRWHKNDIIAKILAINNCTTRIKRDFNNELPKLRIFSHPNILPVIGYTETPTQIIVISQFMPYGSLYFMLHGNGKAVVDAATALRFAIDVAKAMAYLHSLPRDKVLPTYNLNSKHVMIDEDFTARINMADAKFSFQEKARVYEPAWMSPETLSKPQEKRNWEAADMWSFAILLWELATREVPFADLPLMECGMKIATEGLRITIDAGISPHIAKLIKICMHEEPGKRPKFDMIVPILEKMKNEAK